MESLPTLIRFITKVLDIENKRPREFFGNTSMQETRFVDLLNSQPFNTETNCEFPTDLTRVLKYATEIRDKRSRNSIDVGKFKDLLKAHIKKLTMRTTEFLNIRKALDERGRTIEDALREVEGSNDKIKDQGIELIDMAMLCVITEVKLNMETQLMPIMETFDTNIYGKVSKEEVVFQFKNAHIGVFEEEKPIDADDKQPTVTAKRYFDSLDQVLDEICNEIQDRNITDFGLTLKDNDLFHEGKITHQ